MIQVAHDSIRSIIRPLDSWTEDHSECCSLPMCRLEPGSEALGDRAALISSVYQCFDGQQDRATLPG